MQDKINFIKWQIISRLPNGSIYERVKASLSEKSLSLNDPFYYIYWLDIKKSLIKKYLFGTYITDNIDYQRFINWLNINYSKDDIFEIVVNGYTIKLPKPFLRDYKCFKAEFLDIIMPSIVGEKKQPFLEGPYEYNNVCLKENSTVLDCGANFGLFSCLAASKNCNVYAFEPTLRVNIDYLSKLPKLYSNVNIVKKAVSDKTGIDFFNVYEDNTSCNSLSENQTNSKNVVKVETTSIDDFVNNNKLNCVDFIKADIEGAERLMLSGAKETLKEFGPDLAICYYHKLDDLKVLRKLILEANPHYEIEVAHRKIYAKCNNK